MVCARYQVSVYRTIGPLVFINVLSLLSANLPRNCFVLPVCQFFY